MLKNNLHIIFLFLTCLTGSQVSAQSNEFFDYVNDGFSYQNRIYQDQIKTVEWKVNGYEGSYPIINLQSNQQLELLFDELSHEVKDYSYKLIHCDAYWEESGIDPFDYIDGFTEDNIFEFTYSFNTKQDYIRYRLLLPNQSMKPTKSGNYLLLVYDANDDENLVLSRRFMVVDQQLEIFPSVGRPTLNRYQYTHQKLDFTIEYSDRNINNPMQDLRVHILQNGRWDNALYDLKPRFIRPERLEYFHNDQNIFKAGKEFRYFDTRNLRFLNERVAHFEEKNDSNFVSIVPDITERNDAYRYYADVNGGFQIGVMDGNFFTTLDADYSLTHFSLSVDEPIKKGNVYVFGGLSDWQIKESFQMYYNYKLKSYQADILLKQGLYNYQYVIVEDGENFNDMDLEAHYWQTENDYIILVYHRPFGSLYDQLIAVDVFNTKRP